MKTRKIKAWARIGQMAFFMYHYYSAELETQFTTYDASKFSGTAWETTCAIIALAFSILFSEAIVRLIIYFSELLEEKKQARE